MDIKQAQEMILAGFAVMNREQRKAILKFLKMAKPKLDFNYPNGAPVTPDEPAATSALILPGQSPLQTESLPKLG